MAPLTWRNVEAPSFAASNALLASANDMFNKGFGALDDTLGRFQGAQINNDSNKVILDAMRYGDPESYKRALMGGTIAGNVDPGNLNAAALDFMAGRERSLVGTDQAKSSLLGTDVANRTNILGLEARGVAQDNFLRENAADTAAREFIAGNLPNFGKDPDAAIRMAQSQIKDPEVLTKVIASIQSNGAAYFTPAYNDNEAWFAEQGLANSAAPPADKVALGGDVSNIPGANANTAALIGNEGGKAGFSAANDEGYVGRGQFGDDRLADAKAAGIIPGDMSKEQFRKSPEAQKAVEAWHFNDIDQYAASNGIDKLYGQNIGGVIINRDSVRAMAHLGGSEGMKLFIQTGGAYNPADSNGTKLSDYGKTYGGGSAEGGQRAPGGARQYPSFPTTAAPNDIDLMSYVSAPPIPAETPAVNTPAQPGDGRPYNPDLGQFAAPTDTPQVENTDTKNVPASTTEAPRTQFDQALDKMLTETDIAGGVEQVRTGLASGKYGASGSPLGDFAGNIGDFFSTTPEEGAKRSAERAAASKALEWWNKRETRQYFIDNPGELEKAQQDPIAYAQAKAGVKPAAASTPAAPATPAGTAAPVDPVAQISAAAGDAEAFDMGTDDAKFNTALNQAVGFTKNANVAVNPGEFLDGYMAKGMPDRLKSPGALATELAERTGMQRNYVVNQLSKLKGLGIPEHVGAQILENNQFAEGEGLLGFMASDKDKVVKANGTGVANDVARFKSIEESVGRQTTYESTEQVTAALQVAQGRQEWALNDRNTKLAAIDAGRLEGVTKEEVIAEFKARMAKITPEIARLNTLASQYSNANLNLEEMAK